MSRTTIGASLATVLAVAAAALLFVLPDAAGAGPSKASPATVGVLQSKLGRILVDGRGRTLYLFEKDRRGTSGCNGACAINWPPLAAPGKLRAGRGARASLLGRTKRRDGRWQVTYNHHPLYTYVGDSKRRETNGEGVDAYGAEWYAVSPAGAKIDADDATAGGDAPPAGGYGY
jgi:predicted lipoprotein with Yx(FWY)xxD motif